MKIIILGPPGTGKGTQAKLISKHFKLKHISSDALREEIKKKTLLGKKVKSYMDKGALVPEKIMFPLLKKRLPSDNFILDGAPRSLKQAKDLKKIFEPDLILSIISSKKILIHRLLNRAKIEGRSDDNLEVMKNRFRIYESKTNPILKYYGNKVRTIDGNGNAQTVYKRVEKVLK